MPATRFEACSLPVEVEDGILDALEGGKPVSSLIVHWRDSGATVLDRAQLAGRLRRSGRAAFAQKVLRADVPKGRVLVFVDLERGSNVTLATLPRRPCAAPPAPALASPPVILPGDADVVLVESRRRSPQPMRIQARGTYNYRQDIESTRHRPGVPRGRCAP